MRPAFRHLLKINVPKKTMKCAKYFDVSRLSVRTFAGGNQNAGRIRLDISWVVSAYLFPYKTHQLPDVGFAEIKFYSGGTVNLRDGAKIAQL